MADDTPEPLDIDALLAAKKPRTVRETIVVDQDAKLTRTFTFVAIGHRAWELLCDEHPPSDEQNERHAQDQERAKVPLIGRTILRWNLETFPPAAISAACVDPKMTVEQATALWTDERFAYSELERLRDAAISANEPRDIASLGKGLTETLFSAPS